MTKEEIIEDDDEEDIEKILEDEEDEILEEQEFRNSRLNQILANPWKDVSLDQRGEVPMVSLESNFEKNAPIEEPKEQINYSKMPEEEEERKYNPASMQGEFINNFISEEEKTLGEQKRLYQAPQELRPDRRKIGESEKEFISREDMIKKDYLSKRNFSS